MYPKLVVCIPTYNRNEIIDEVLRQELEMFREYGIQVIVYDSSEGQETERICQDYVEKGFENLSLKKIDSKVASNQKIYMIWQDMEDSEYDYVWLIHDHRVCTKKAIKYILRGLTEKRDFYILNTLGKEQFKYIEISSKNDFFHEGASFLTLYGASIINIRTFIRGTDWKNLESKYLKKGNMNFSQLGFYYDRAVQIENFKASLLQFPYDSFVYLPVNEQGVHGWYDEAIRIWTKCWASTILKLPSCYEGKKEVIRSMEHIHLSRKQLIDYRKDNVFNWWIFLKYAKWIKLVSSQNPLQFYFIAIGKNNYALKIHDKEFAKKVKIAQKKHIKTVIFGAGKRASFCAKLLEENRVQFDAFLISEKRKNPDTLQGHPVVIGGEYFEREDDVLVVIAVISKIHRKEILDYLSELNRKIDFISYEEW